MRAIKYILFVLLTAWLLVALWHYKPWYNRSLFWQIYSVDNSTFGRTFRDVLEQKYPFGTPSEPAMRDLEANGFECHRRVFKERNLLDAQIKEQRVIDCNRGFELIIFLIPAYMEWRAIIYLDDTGRIQRFIGQKNVDAP